MLDYLPAPIRLLVQKHQRFFRFAVVGTICTGVDFAIFFTLYHFGIGIIPANIAAYSMGIVVNFFLNRHWTFADSEHRHVKRITLAVVYGYIGLGLSTAMVWLLARIVPVVAAKVITVLVMLFVNYSVNKYFIFRTRH